MAAAAEQLPPRELVGTKSERTNTVRLSASSCRCFSYRTAIVSPAHFFLRREKKKNKAVFPEISNGELAVCFSTWARGVTDGVEKSMSVFCVLPFSCRLSTACRR
jgi:hypothetical protein